MLVLAACTSGTGSPSPSASESPVGIVESPYGRVWLRLPADFPLLASGEPLQRLDVLDASGAIWSPLSTEDAAAAATADLRRLGWEAADPAVASEGRWRIEATRSAGACKLTVIVEALGSRTSLLVYLGEGCPQP